MFSGRYTYARPFARFENLVAFVICFALDLMTRHDASAGQMAKLRGDNRAFLLLRIQVKLH